MTRPTDPLRRAWYELCRALIMAEAKAELHATMEKFAVNAMMLDVVEGLLGIIGLGSIAPGGFPKGGTITPGTFAPFVIGEGGPEWFHPDTEH